MQFIFEFLLEKPWRRDLAALFAGALMPLAYAPYDLFFIPILSVALMLWIWQNTSYGYATRHGWFFGLGMFGVGVSWVFVAMNVFGHMSIALAGFCTAVFVMFLSLYPAITGYLCARLIGENKFSHSLFFMPAMWVVLEWVRGWLFTGFPWLLVGYSQVESPIAAYAPLLGVLGVSWITVLSASLLMLFFQMGFKPKVGIAVVLTALWTGGFFIDLLSWTKPAGEKLSVAILQGNIPQEEKWLPEKRAHTMALYRAMTMEKMNKQVIVLPENALPEFYHNIKSTYLAYLDDIAKSNGAGIIIGMPIQEPAGERFYNGMAAVGNGRGQYLKHHLVPFGEYIPMERWLGNLMEIMNVPMSNFSSGPLEQDLMRVAGHPVGITICYEDIFPEEVITRLPEAHFLVNASNNGWYGDSLAPHQHLQIAQMRAKETARYILRATTNGISAIINERGRLQVTSRQFEVAAIEGELTPFTGATPYVRFGNYLILTLLSLSLAASFFTIKKIK